MVENILNDTGESNAIVMIARDADGSAAILLVESLIHELVARSVISTHDAVEIVGTAIDVRKEVELEHDDRSRPRGALTVLESIQRSLAADLPVA